MSGTNEWGRQPEPQHATSEGAPNPAGDPFVAPSIPGFGRPAQPAPWPSGAPGPLIAQRDSPSGASIAALALSILGAILGLVIGWGFPLSIVALVLALVSRKASPAARRLATWSIALVAVSGIASVAWLVYSILYLLG